jgi:hypothetical protein
MGVSDPEIRTKVFGPKWVEFQHFSEKKSWSWWKRLLHRFEHCPICSQQPAKIKN